MYILAEGQKYFCLRASRFLYIRFVQYFDCGLNFPRNGGLRPPYIVWLRETKRRGWVRNTTLQLYWIPDQVGNDKMGKDFYQP